MFAIFTGVVILISGMLLFYLGVPDGIPAEQKELAEYIQRLTGIVIFAIAAGVAAIGVSINRS